MELRQIRYFVAVYEEGSFSKAATREHCTQPGISVQIQKLEAEVNHKLFERQARGVVPTLAGRHLYASCRGVLAELRGARQRMLDLSGTIGGQLKIGLAPTLCLSALPRVLPGYLAEHPYVEVRVAEALSGTLMDWVVAGELDAAVVTEPPQHLGLTCSPFLRDELVLVMSPHLAATRQPRTWAALRRTPLVLPSGKHGLRHTIATQAGLAEGSGRTVEVDGLLATLEVVRASDLVTVLPICAVFERVERGELIAERFSDGVFHLDFFLVHANTEPLSVATQDLLAQLKKAAEQITADWRDRLGARMSRTKRTTTAGHRDDRSAGSKRRARA